MPSTSARPPLLSVAPPQHRPRAGRLRAASCCCRGPSALARADTAAAHEWWARQRRLKAACAAGDEIAAEREINAGAAAEWLEDQPLFQACHHGRVGMVKKLVARRVAVAPPLWSWYSARPGWYSRPVCAGEKRSGSSYCPWCLDLGDSNLPETLGGRCPGATALHWAALSGNVGLCRCVAPSPWKLLLLKLSSLIACLPRGGKSRLRSVVQVGGPALW